MDGTIDQEDTAQMDQDLQENSKEIEEIVDPHDPFYGLEERLKYSNLDNEVKQIIKERLAEAHEKVKKQLELRQT